MSLNKSLTRANIGPIIKPFKGNVNVPGSKSYTNRALIIASLANGVSTLTNYSNSSDSLLLIRILKKLGVKIIKGKDGIKVFGNGVKFKKFYGSLNVKDAGTVMRFLTALCCLIPGEIILKGTPRMNKRPVKGLVDTLIHLGANITYLGEVGFPPLKIKGGNLHGRKVKIDASQSSQFISALLLIAPFLDFDLDIITHDEIVSHPYIDMTLNQMKHFGVNIENTRYRHYSVKKGQRYQASQIHTESDASSATYFFGIAAITQSTIKVDNLSPISKQGDIRFANLLSKMGCKVKADVINNSIEITGAKNLKSIKVDMRNMPDAAPALAVVASFATGTTNITGLKNLELKESKRLTALQTELNKMGIVCYSDGEQLTIKGGNPRGTLINTYNDHRIAMAFAIAGTRVRDISIESPEAVRKSFPGFWDTLKEIGVKIDFEKKGRNIVLIGFMGAGKTTIAKLLSEKLRLHQIETDDEIVVRSGFTTVNEIFEKKGEVFFREIEKEVISDFALKTNCIISCGGGAINSQENMNVLKENGNIMFLSASFKTITGRLQNQQSRPLFADKEKAKNLYQHRLPLYKKYADEIIITDNLTPDEVTELISSKLPKHG